ncbi:MAG: CvpA family protein [Calditrichaeota bacterium]|nr:MAG: CvpA family protein [Calditrichota bacterium]
MRKLNENQRAQFQDLLTKGFDNQLDADEMVQFDNFLQEYPECAKEWQDMKSLQHVTSTMKFKQPSKEVWDMYWHDTYNRLERGFAWIVFSLGAFLVGAFVIYQFITQFLVDSNVPEVLRWGISFLAIGGLALFISVLREKLFTRKRDPYKEIER